MFPSGCTALVIADASVMHGDVLVARDASASAMGGDDALVVGDASRMARDALVVGDASGMARDASVMIPVP
jgi:hypothetical protein